ncbi:hypothetical protein B0H14DRAFT_3427405 [Mycena olivaceomarginata]|nr:hypothetical protein B0H14DRAFT_3427405 [Mycena olivaceomarginata]
MLEKLLGKKAAATKKTSGAKKAASNGGAKRKASGTIPVGETVAKKARLAAETAKLDDFLDGRAGKKPREFASNDLTDAPAKDGWQEVSVDIQVPDGKIHTSYEDIPVFSVPGLHFRNLTEVIKAALQDQSSRSFHYTPFEHLWKPSTGDVQHVYNEIYSSDAFIEAHNKLQKQPPEPGCSLECAIVVLMLWSDSTHLANFGTVSLWPLYLFFGNLSKWVRSKPRAGAFHHVAYMPKLPDEFNDWCRAVLGEAPTSELLTQCRFPMTCDLACPGESRVAWELVEEVHSLE